MATPWTALITTQVEVTGVRMLTAQLDLPVLPLESVTVTSYVKLPETVGIVHGDGVAVEGEAGRETGDGVGVAGPGPPEAVRVTGVMAMPLTALITTQLEVTGGGQ